jgi:dTDP-4-amino-4,6-dideoxy-D-glucose acyltransferase
MSMKVGKNVTIHPTVQIFGEDRIEIGDNTRIDAFGILSAGSHGYLKIGSHIHIATYCGFYGGAGMVLEDFVEIAPGFLAMSESDDFFGNSLVGPQIPMKYKPDLKTGKPVIIGRHVLFGARTTVMCCSVGEGVSTGAHTLILSDLPPWGIYVGAPARRIGERSKKMLELEREFLKEWNDGNRTTVS